MNPITGKVPQILKHAAVWTVLLLLTLTHASQAALLFSSNGSTITITGSNPKASGALVIPSTIDTLPVTAIGDSAFESCTALTCVTIPTSVKSIGVSAFYNCAGLKSVTIPTGIIAIGNGVFYQCSRLTSVTIPANVTAISASAFRSCTELTSVYFMGNPPSTGIDVFYDTPSTIYYIQGQTGWIATFADRPTAAFEPLAISV